MSGRYYVGLAATFHDPALAIVAPDGEVVFAEAAERFLQDKRAFNCPPDHFHRVPELIEEYCERGAELCVVTTWSDEIVTTYRAAIAGYRAQSGLIDGRAETPDEFTFALQSALVRAVDQAGRNIEMTAPVHGCRVTRRAYDHHLTHAATACFTSGFDDCLCAVVDGYGERAACDFFQYRKGKLRRIKTPPPVGTELGSLGGFYGMLCGLCGFDPSRGEEWKVMGLAAYGKVDEQLRDRFGALHRVEDLSIHLNAPSYPATMAQFAPWQRRPGSSALTVADVARTGQVVFGEVMTRLLRNALLHYPSPRLALGGGCALNSAWNGRIARELAIDELHVPCAPGDDGNALGAALLAFHDDHPDARPSPRVATPYLGSRMSRERIGQIVEHGGHGAEVLADRELIPRVASMLADGKIVGWVDGRAEFGPRALGHRSILADPRKPGMKDLINARIKFREAFRPFAPSVLAEYGPEYFEDYQPSPYMDRALTVRPQVQELIPAVVHVDGTARLQTVNEDWAPRYAGLLREFHRQTGVAMLLNTSFNVMGKPIVHAPEDALAVFHSAGLDALVLDDTLIIKR